MASPKSARDLLNAAMSEDELQAGLIEHAQLHGWLVYHTHDSRRSKEGFPDLVLVRECVIFWELKRQGKNPTVPQQEWLDRLAGAGTVESAVIRPADYDRALARLARRRPR